MPSAEAAVINLDTAILTGLGLACSACGNVMLISLSRDKKWLVHCPSGSCERFQVKYYAPLLPLIKYEEPT